MLIGDVLDYGCGRGDDANTLEFDQYDPWYYPGEPEKLYDTITCIYVLNVLEEPCMETWMEVIDKMRQHLKEDGCIYVAVRRGLEKTGKTSIGTYQWDVDLSEEFDTIVENARYAIYAISKE